MISSNREQLLIDIMFQIGLMIHSSENLKSKSVPEVAEWIAGQLKDCGFPTYSCGSSWGILEK